MNGRLRKNVGLFLVPFSFLFLIDPGVALFDPLPDFLGYALLCYSIINIADINSTLMDAFKKFRMAALLSVLRFAALAVVELAFEDRDSTVISLLFIFVLALFNMVTLLPAYKYLFSGLLQLGTYHEGESVYRKTRENGANASEKMYVLSSAFVIVSNFMWALPEFTTLAENETYEFINVLRLFGAIIAVPVGIFWLVRMIVYFVRVNKDTAFVENLKNTYLERTEGNESFFVGRTLSVGLATLTVALVLTLKVSFDNAVVIPGAISYIAIILAAIIVRRYSKKLVALTVCSSIGAAISIIADLSSSYFFERYLATDVIKDIGAYNAYYFMLLANAVEQAIFLTAVILVVFVLKDVYINNTDISLDAQAKESKRMLKGFVIGAVSVVLTSLLSCAGEMFYYYSLPNAAKAELFGMSSVINTSLSIVFIFASWYFIGYIKSAVKQHCKQYLY